MSNHSANTAARPVGASSVDYEAYVNACQARGILACSYESFVSEYAGADGAQDSRPIVSAIKSWRQRLGLAAAYPLHAPTDVERAMVAEIAELRALPTATHGPLALTNRKTADITGRGYNVVGYVLRRCDGEEVAISAESAVRWLPQAHYWRLMHEQDGSLFAGSALPEIEAICDAYESGVGHGMQKDGKYGDYYAGVACNQAYRIGYENGAARAPSCEDSQRQRETRMDTGFGPGGELGARHAALDEARALLIPLSREHFQRKDASEEFLEGLAYGMAAYCAAIKKLQGSVEPDLKIAQEHQQTAGAGEFSRSTPAQQEQHWIRVDERTPAAGQKVIAYRPTAEQTQDQPVDLIRYLGDDYPPRQSWQGVAHRFECICHPTHWMPLPRPPEVAQRQEQES